MTTGAKMASYWCDHHVPWYSGRAATLVPLVEPEWIKPFIAAWKNKQAQQALTPYAPKPEPNRLGPATPAANDTDVAAVVSRYRELRDAAAENVTLKARLARADEALKAATDALKQANADRHRLAEEVARLTADNERLLTEGLALLEHTSQQAAPPADEDADEGFFKAVRDNINAQDAPVADREPVAGDVAALLQLDLPTLLHALELDTAARPLTADAAAERDYKKAPLDARPVIVAGLQRLAVMPRGERLGKVPSRNPIVAAAGEHVYQLYATPTWRVLVSPRGTGFLIRRITTRSDSTVFRGEH